MGRPAAVIKRAGDKMSAIVNQATKEYVATTGYMPDVNTSYIFGAKEKKVEVDTKVEPVDSISEFGIDDGDTMDIILDRMGDTPHEPKGAKA